MEIVMSVAIKDKQEEVKENPAIINLRHQIKSRVEAIGSNIRALERRAGLNIGTVNNIISGASTNPTAETLMALATTFDCSIDELLGRKAKESDKQSLSLNDFQSFKWNKELFATILSALNKELDKRKITISSDKALTIIHEVYLYSLRKEKDTVEGSLIEWLLDKIL